MSATEQTITNIITSLESYFPDVGNGGSAGGGRRVKPKSTSEINILANDDVENGNLENDDIYTRVFDKLELNRMTE